MLDLLVHPDLRPFSIAALVLIGLTVFEILTLLIGKPLSAVLDHAIGSGEVDGLSAGKDGLAAKSGLFGAAFDWLNIGRVPFFILLIIALAAFSICGFALQIGLNGLWRPMPALLAAIVVLVPTAYATRWISRLVTKVVPRDETYVQTARDFIGLVGVVTVGPVRAGVVARARILDRHGNAHFPRVEPADPESVIPQGASILVIDVRRGVLAVALADPALIADQPAGT